MHPRFALLAGVLLVAPIAPLAAQGGVRLGLGGGISLPVRSYADQVKRGWLGTVNLSYFPAASASLGFRIDGFMARNNLDGTSGKATHTGGTANLMLQFGARQSPNRFYVFGGGGFVRSKTEGPAFGEVLQTNPALSTGVGVSFGAKSFAFFVEARYLSVYSDKTKPQLTPLIAGVTFGGL